MPTDQTNPLDAGHTTTESKGSKLVVVLASVIAALGTITSVLEAIGGIVPESTKGLGMWIAVGGVAVAGLTQIAYTVMRSWIKVEAIKAGTTPPPDPTDPVVKPNPDDAASRLGA